eukprot:2261181-Prymnesium_polylepis.1
MSVSKPRACTQAHEDQIEPCALFTQHGLNVIRARSTTRMIGERAAAKADEAARAVAIEQLR